MSTSSPCAPDVASQTVQACEAAASRDGWAVVATQLKELVGVAREWIQATRQAAVTWRGPTLDLIAAAAATTARSQDEEFTDALASAQRSIAAIERTLVVPQMVQSTSRSTCARSIEGNESTAGSAAAANGPRTGPTTGATAGLSRLGLFANHGFHQVLLAVLASKLGISYIPICLLVWLTLSATPGPGNRPLGERVGGWTGCPNLPSRSPPTSLVS